MDFSINDHLVNTVHFRPLIKDSFNELGPEAFNSGYTNYSIIENDLSLTDKLNLENAYFKLNKKNNINEIEDKLNDMINERTNYKNIYSTDDKEKYKNQIFIDKFLYFIENTKKSLVVLKLDEISYKYIYTNVFNFYEIYNLYKTMFQDIKIDLGKSKFCIKQKEQVVLMQNNIEEIIQDFKDLIKENPEYFINELLDSNIGDIEINTELISKINKYNIMDNKSIDNLDLITIKNKEILSIVEKLNKLIEDHNSLSTYKLSNVQLDTLNNDNDDSYKIVPQKIPMFSTPITFLPTPTPTLLINEPFTSNEPFISNELKMTFNPIGRSTKNMSYNLVPEPKINKMVVSPWNNSTIEPVINMELDNNNFNVDPIKKELKIQENKNNFVLYNKYFGRILLVDFVVNSLNILPEFEIIKSLSNFEYKQLKKNYMEQLENYDESDNIEDMKVFIQICLDEIILIEREEKVLLFIKDYFRFTNNLEDKMKFSEISSIVNNNFIEKISNVQLANYLKKLGLEKKRYNNGIYWYGLIDRNEEMKKDISNKFNDLNLTKNTDLEQLKNLINNFKEQYSTINSVNILEINKLLDECSNMIINESDKHLIQEKIDYIKNNF